MMLLVTLFLLPQMKRQAHSLQQPTVCRKAPPKGYLFQPSGITQGAFHHTKIFGNFGRKINGTLWSVWKFSGQNGPLPEVVLLYGWSGPTETSRSTSKNFLFQSYFAKQQSKFRPKRKWIVSMRLKTLFQQNNVVPFSLDDSTNHECLVWQMESTHSLRCSRPTHASPGPLVQFVQPANSPRSIY